MSIEEKDRRTTPEEAVEQLERLNGDPEQDHPEAEDILCATLRFLGHAEIAQEFIDARDRVGFWYA